MNNDPAASGATLAGGPNGAKQNRRNGHIQVRIFRNNHGSASDFLVLRLESASPNTRAYGARLKAHIAGRILYREVSGGGSYASHSDKTIDLGVSGHGRVDRLEIRWPDGSVEELSSLEGGQTVVWRQGEGVVERRPLEGAS